MTDRSSDPEKNATPEDIATLYSRANMQGTKYWDFSASRKEVRGEFRHRLLREQLVREQAERAGAEQQATQRAQKDQAQAHPQAQLPRLEPQARNLRPAEELPLGGPRGMTGIRAAPPALAGSTLRTGAQAGRGESLPKPREVPPAASRWYALQSVLAPVEEAAPPAPVSPPMPLDSRPPMVAVFSLAGGVGKTCLVATLGRALSALGEHVLLADTATCGLLPFYFGSREFKPGVVRTFSGAESDAPVEVVALEAERYPGEGDEHDPLLGELVRDGRGVHRTLVDVATGNREVTRRLLLLRPTVLVPILPDMSSVASLGSLEAFLAGAIGPAAADGVMSETFYLLNQFDVSSPLHLDVREMLFQQLGDRLLPFVLRRSSEVSEALAEGMTVIDYAPGSAAAEDYWQLADWLRSFAAPAATGYGGVRWSER